MSNMTPTVNIGEHLPNISKAGKKVCPVGAETAEKKLLQKTAVETTFTEVHTFTHKLDSINLLDQAEDPQDEALADALEAVQAAIAKCKDDPGALATEEFTAAARFIRAEAPDKWFGLRVAIKAAKPSGVLLGDVDRMTRPQGEAAPDDSSMADDLVALVQESADLFHAPDGTCFAALGAKGGPPITYRLDTQAFGQWASYAYYVSTATKDRPGRAANETALRTARTVLAGLATHEGGEQEVFLRAGHHNGAYYLDLGTEDWNAIEITAHGWRLVDRPPVRFWRPGTLRPLPMPVPGGDLERLWKYANVPDESKPLVLAWLMDALRPDTHFPVLELIGLQGTAKSFTHTMLRNCIDPNAVPLRAASKSTEDLFVSAGANWVASFNNLSHLSASAQDALCTLATGGGFAGRTLYTNADETLIEAKRPVILNGIVPLVTAQDLTDRVIHVELPAVETYRTETALLPEFGADAPLILGGLLDLFVATLAKLPDVQLAKPPRMADYAHLGEAMTQSQGKEPGAFMALYGANRQESISRAMEASPVAMAVRELAAEHTLTRTPVWDGTMGALLDRLHPYRDGTDDWPRSARGLGAALRRQSPALAVVGIDVTIEKPGRDGVRVIIRKRERVKVGELGFSVKLPSEKFFASQHDEEAF